METGSKLWRWKYRFNKSENRFSIGPYPEISIKQAREARDGARALLRSGIDPNAHKTAKKATQSKTADNTFEVLALEWHRGRSRALAISGNPLAGRWSNQRGDGYAVLKL
tara:strand:+ start:291 stop:620 length:330 start_codon:yes stop_codon:yes gene_type:complete